jgi:hypothetical protein
MKRRDLEELRKQQRDRQQRKRKLWLRYGAIALGVGAVLFWMFLGKRLFNAALVSGDCKRIEQSLSTLGKYSELSGEFGSITSPIVLSKPIVIDNVNRERMSQIADAIDSEYERLKVLSIKDELLKQYYSQFVDSLKFHATTIRNFIANPSLETYKGDRSKVTSPITSISKIDIRCNGFTNEEYEQMSRQWLNEWLSKQKEEDAKNNR